MDEAKAAADKLAQGTTFEALAAERGLKDSDIDLGTVAKSAVVDRDVADAAFALKAGEVSAPVQGRFGIAIVKVDATSSPARCGRSRRSRPSSSATCRPSAPRTKSPTCRTRSRTNGSAARRSPTRRASSSSSRAPSRRSTATARIRRATPVADLPQNVDVLAAAFAAEVHGENEPLRVPNSGGYVWFDVEAITPARDRPLDEVKDQVVARWRDDEIAARLKAKATEMLDKIKAGTTFADVAAAEKLKVEWRPGIKRSSPPPGLSAARGRRRFSRRRKDARRQRRRREPDRADRVSRHRDQGAAARSARPPTPSASTRRCSTRIAEDLLAQYIARLQNDIGVTINQSALNQVTGGGSRRTNASLKPMQIEPTADAFAARYDRGEAQVVWTTLVADLETPVSAFLKIAGARPMSFLLESVEGGAVRGRYSVIGLDPDLIWRTQRRARRDQPRGAQPSPTLSRPARSRRSRRCAR